ncbi:MAG: C39 family peptidase [Bacillota bacterium]|nr:C39 family peptidase [Bacillota bacterium]
MKKKYMWLVSLLLVSACANNVVVEEPVHNIEATKEENKNGIANKDAQDKDKIDQTNNNTETITEEDKNEITNENQQDKEPDKIEQSNNESKEEKNPEVPVMEENESVTERYFLQVPTYVQETSYYCSVAALQSVMAYHGIYVSQVELATDLRTDPVTGTEYEDLARVATKRMGMNGTYISER